MLIEPGQLDVVAWRRASLQVKRDDSGGVLGGGRSVVRQAHLEERLRRSGLCPDPEIRPVDRRIESGINRDAVLARFPVGEPQPAQVAVRQIAQGGMFK